MNHLRNRFDRFCLRNRDKGIPNLMLYIAIGNAIVLLLNMLNGGGVLYALLCFDKALILKGQVWRLLTYVFTQSTGSFLGLIFLYFFYMLGRHVELSMGTLRFNLFYLSGVLLMDLFAMLFAPVPVNGAYTQAGYNILPVYYNMAYYLHLSLLLTFATTHPDSQFLILFIIPVKARIMAIVYLALTAVEIFNLSFPVLYFPHNLFPLVALANYLLFAGPEIANLFPSVRRRKKPVVEPIPFRRDTPPQPTYRHRCTICGRTDISHPSLEFRYCSRCNGYYCYCQDHISDHTHIE